MFVVLEYSSYGLKKCKTGILKKLDRILVNGMFIETYDKGNAIFLPKVISDHCPAVLIFPTSYSRNSKPFRLSNFIVDKPEFLDIIKEEWN